MTLTIWIGRLCLPKTMVWRSMLITLASLPRWFPTAKSEIFGGIVKFLVFVMYCGQTSTNAYKTKDVFHIVHQTTQPIPNPFSDSAHIFSWSQNCSPFGFQGCHHLGIIHNLSRFWLVLNQANCLVPCKAGPQEPAPTSALSTGCTLLLSCGWTSTELIFNLTEFCKK